MKIGTKSKTVANRYSDLIIALETAEKNGEDISDPDPKYKIFLEDEYYESSDKEEELGISSEIECSEDEMEA